jgi:hypothetical protein
VGVLHTANLPANQLLLRLAITPDEWQAGLPVQRARQQITEFLRPHDVLCAWNSSSHQILCELGVGVQGHEQQGHAQLVLKGAYCDYVRYLHFAQSMEGTSTAAPCKFGELDQILKSLGLASSAAQPGRGSQRLAQTSAMLAWLRRHAFNHLK